MMNDILSKVQSLQKRVKKCGVTITIDYSIGYDGKNTIDVYVHNSFASCEMFTFSSLNNKADNFMQMEYLKSYLKEIKAFKQ